MDCLKERILLPPVSQNYSCLMKGTFGEDQLVDKTTLSNKANAIFNALAQEKRDNSEKA